MTVNSPIESVRRAARRAAAASLTLLALAAPAPSLAAMVGFSCITPNAAVNCATAEAQVGVDVSATAGGVAFTFRNTGPDASSIADVYFQSSLFGSLYRIDNTPGLVEFAVGARPSNLPGGRGLTDPFRATLSAGSVAPVQPRGVNPGEALTLYLTLLPGRSLSDVLSGLAAGTLRIGLHIQGFGDGGSVSVISDPQSVVPIPAAVWLLGSGVLLLAGFGRAGRAASTAGP